MSAMLLSRALVRAPRLYVRSFPLQQRLPPPVWDYAFHMRAFSSYSNYPPAQPPKKWPTLDEIAEKARNQSMKVVAKTKELAASVKNDPKIMLVWSKKAKDVIVHEGKKLWYGSKLLAADLRIGGKLLRRSIRGKNLNRRERKALKQATGDALKLFPFSLFVIIPFAELALPFFLKLFPNMLPGPFIDQTKKDEAVKRKIQARADLAGFLQEMVVEQADRASVDPDFEKESKLVKNFVRKVRTGGAYQLDNQDIFKFAKLFKQRFTLDDMSGQQLTILCHYIGIKPFKNVPLMRWQIRQQLKKLRQDDKQIWWEGLDSLSEQELEEACRMRGMRSTGVPTTLLKRQLVQWLNLSMSQEVPSSLLILSRAFTFTEPEPGSEPRLDKALETLSETDSPKLDELEFTAHTLEEGLDAFEKQEQEMEGTQPTSKDEARTH